MNKLRKYKIIAFAMVGIFFLTVVCKDLYHVFLSHESSECSQGHSDANQNISDSNICYLCNFQFTHYSGSPDLQVTGECNFQFLQLAFEAENLYDRYRHYMLPSRAPPIAKIA